MKEKDKERPRRTHVLAVKLTDEEKAVLDAVVRERCVNMSALVRKLLFESLQAGK